ncbi:hypothetical protein FRC07_005532, partial [Ceratobasidium sp. 392]
MTRVHPLSSENQPTIHDLADPVVARVDHAPKDEAPVTSNRAVPPEDAQEDASDSDTEMASAQPTFGDQSQEEGETFDRDPLKLVPNLFRLLDLVDEQGSGGIVEKMVIDQTSLHRLLNTVQPGSYDSVSKINFKSLDQLSIKATGLYGTRAEIVKYLRRVRCLSDEAHGSMTATKWALEKSDANPMYELEGRKFGSGDEGASMMCSLICKAQGRHAHIDYCRNPDNCDEPEYEHINELMHPEPDRPKDWTSHRLSWARSGFKDPYSQAEQTEFFK